MNNNFKLGKEIDLLEKYPKAKRDLNAREQTKSEKVREIARKFEKDFFDGGREYGYGGFNYNEKYWIEVVKDFQKYWKLDSNSKVLDVGCAKGFMIYDIMKLIPEIKVKGIDISKYAIENSKEEVKEYLMVGDAKNLPFEDNEFDVVISINSIHNLDIENCGKALREIERVSKKNSFITVDAYRDDNEKKRMEAWNLTAKTIMSVEDWKYFFKKNNYSGDFFWFIP
jgi:ubiquinone/menaquinone biosynthesis C-methylase UbiE|tara:strand:+ start:149 stop:826 length:678 start_codon:yes stop_codon:yes gene_type:complete